MKRPPLPKFRYLEEGEIPVERDLLFIESSDKWLSMSSAEIGVDPVLKCECWCTMRPRPKKGKK